MVSEVLALQMAELGSILGTTYGPLSTANCALSRKKDGEELDFLFKYVKAKCSQVDDCLPGTFNSAWRHFQGHPGRSSGSEHYS